MRRIQKVVRSLSPRILLPNNKINQSPYLNLVMFLCIQDALKEKEQYLHTAKVERLQFNTRWQEVTGWLNTVDIQARPGFDGVDFATMETEIELKKVGSWY